jgi:hypothetical protein
MIGRTVEFLFKAQVDEMPSANELAPANEEAL